MTAEMTNPDSQTSFDPPRAPVVGMVTHHTIELSWETEENRDKHGPPENWNHFSVEELHHMSNTYRSIHFGYSSHLTVEGLKHSTHHMFRLIVTRPTGESLCGPPVSVSTTREPLSGKHLHRAVDKNNEEEVTKVLLSGTVCVNVTDKMGFTPLMVAAQKDYIRIVHQLVENGADVNMKNGSGRDSLMLACFGGHLDTVKYLRQHGATWNSQDKGGCSALHWAADAGHLAVIAYMIQDGCELDVRDNIGHWTPLMRVAAVSGNSAVARILIRAGADVNDRDKDGKTPLMVAVLNNYEDLVVLLLDNGADRTVKNKYGSGATEMAKAFKRKKIVTLLAGSNNVPH